MANCILGYWNIEMNSAQTSEQARLSVQGYEEEGWYPDSPHPDGANHAGIRNTSGDWVFKLSSNYPYWGNSANVFWSETALYSISSRTAPLPSCDPSSPPENSECNCQTEIASLQSQIDLMKSQLNNYAGGNIDLNSYVRKVELENLVSAIGFEVIVEGEKVVGID